MGALGSGPVHTPQPINLFMDLRVEPDGALSWGPAPTAAGDHVILQAEMGCVVGASACPHDLNQIDRFKPTTVGIELLGAGGKVQGSDPTIGFKYSSSWLAREGPSA